MAPEGTTDWTHSALQQLRKAREEVNVKGKVKGEGKGERGKVKVKGEGKGGRGKVKVKGEGQGGRVSEIAEDEDQ